MFWLLIPRLFGFVNHYKSRSNDVETPWYHYPMGRTKTTIAMQVICSLFLAGSLTFERHSTYSGSVWSLYPANFPLPFEAIDIVVFLAIASATYLVLELAKRCVWKFTRSKSAPTNQASSASKETTMIATFKDNKILGLIAFVAPLICWLIVFLNYYPGTGMNDQIVIIENPIALSNNHPIFYVLSLSGSVMIGETLFGSANAGHALFVIAQMILCSAVVSFCALWLRYRKCHVAIIAIFIAFFSLCPVVSNYAISTLKDTLFAYCLLLWIPFLVEAASAPKQFWKKKSSYVVFFLLIVATILIRNNGLYIALALAVVISIVYRRSNLKHIALVAVAALVIGLLPNFGLSVLGQQQLFRESVGIPLQQVAAVGCIAPDSLTDEQAAYLNQLLPLDQYRTSYAPMNVDQIKYAADFNTFFLQDTKAEFLKNYLQIGMAQPDLYTRAYLAETYGYWSIIAPNESQSFLYALSDNVKLPRTIEIMEEYGLGNESIYPTTMAQSFDALYRSLMLFPGSGFCFFLVLLLGYAITLLKPSGKWLLVILPCTLVWATVMVSAPVSSALRYTYPLVVAIPLLITIITLLLRSSHRLAYQ